MAGLASILYCSAHFCYFLLFDSAGFRGWLLGDGSPLNVYNTGASFRGCSTNVHFGKQCSKANPEHMTGSLMTAGDVSSFWRGGKLLRASRWRTAFKKKRP